MHDGGKIILGLILFLAIIAFPVWYNVASGKAGYVPQLEKAAKGDRCVMTTELMRETHMDLLDAWRDEVVREANRYDDTLLGYRIEKSLTNTCLDCHNNKSRFCDRCHDYLGVSPYCWDCHIVTEEGS